MDLMALQEALAISSTSILFKCAFCLNCIFIYFLVCFRGEIKIHIYYGLFQLEQLYVIALALALITHQYVMQMGWKKLHLHES